MAKNRPLRKAIAISEMILKLGQDASGEPNLMYKFPRDIELLINYGLSIPIMKIEDLTTQMASRTLCALGGYLIESTEIVDRSIWGLLHIGPPANLIFIKNGLPNYLTNYILAHEVGHFMADIFYVRELWAKSLPEQKEAIMRAFSWQEYDSWIELSAALRGLPSRPKTITARDSTMAPETSEREIQADLIARELLAPWDYAIKLFKEDKSETIRMFHQTFELPKRIASYYYDEIQRSLYPAPDLVERLFGPLLSRKGNSESKH